MMTKKKIRLAVFIPVFGIPSEIWSVRQCLGFESIEPVIICWHIHPETPKGNYGLECHQLAAPWEQHRSIIRRIRLKLGSQKAVLPTVEEQLEIKTLLSNLCIDAILCHFAWTGIRVGSAISGIIPTIWHVHGRDVSASLESSAYQSVFQKLLPTAVKVVAVGAFQLARMQKLGLRPDQGILIPCGAPLKQFSANPIPIKNKNEKIRIIAVGRFSHEKGPLETIKAFSLVAKKIPEIELILIGDGELKKNAEELTLKLGIQDKVTFTGTLSPQLVAKELSKGHIFTQHSQEYKGWIEGFGVTLTEAGAAGLPLVVSLLGGIINQAVDGKNAIIFRPGDISAQAQAMLSLAQNEKRRYQMGATARKIASEFDSQVQIKKLEQLILRTI